MKKESAPRISLATIDAITVCERERIICALLHTKPFDVVESVDEPQGVRFSLRKLQALLAPKKEKK